jgi:hypothetical protein
MLIRVNIIHSFYYSSYCLSLTIPPGSGVKVSDFKALKREVYDKKEKACPFNEEGQAEVFSFSTGYQR